MVLSLDEKFTRAVKYIQGLPSDGPYNPSNDEKLGFYALFKQATEGPNKKKKPGMLDLIARAKWDAWHKLGNISADDAKKKYVEQFLKVAKKINNDESKAVIKEMTATAPSNNNNNNNNNNNQPRSRL